MIDLGDINEMDAEDFVDVLGDVFARGTWIAECACGQRPFDSVDALHAAMFDVLRRAPREAQLAFLCAQSEVVGPGSAHQRCGAELAAPNSGDLAEGRRLSRSYRRRHGFPFIIAADRHTKEQILGELRRRVRMSTADEFVEAMAQIRILTRARLRARVEAAGTISEPTRRTPGQIKR